jgi:hypothetical protein
MRRSECRLACAAIAVGACSRPAAEPVDVTYPHNVVVSYALRAIDPAVLDAALAETAPAFGDGANAGNHAKPALRAAAWFVLVVDAAQGDVLHRDEVLSRAHALLAPGSEPTCNGGLDERGENAALSGLAVLATTDLWAMLSPDDRARADAVLRACFVAAAVVSSDAGDLRTGLDGTGNFRKTWGMNYREGFIGALLAGAVYLGPKAQAVLDAFSTDALIAEAEALDLPNIATTFRTQSNTPVADPTAADIDRLAHGFRWHGFLATEIEAIHGELVREDFPHPISCEESGDGSHAWVACCCPQESPFFGQAGMAEEFKKQDTDGLRSSASYVAEGLKNTFVTLAMLRLAGREMTDPELYANRFRGVTDFYFKIDHGYYSVSQHEDDDLVQDVPTHRSVAGTLGHGLWAALNAADGVSVP